MKKELLVHGLYLAALLILVAVARNYLVLTYWSFWLGGIVGIILPYADHFIYIYAFAPYELSSQRVISLITQKKYLQALDMAVYTGHERAKLIFHTAYFQAIFWVLTFYMVTSSGSVFGIGLVLAFALHLIIDQVQELTSVGHLNSWFQELTSWFPNGLDKRGTGIYFGANLLLLLLVGFVF